MMRLHLLICLTIGATLMRVQPTHIDLKTPTGTVKYPIYTYSTTIESATVTTIRCRIDLQFYLGLVKNKTWQYSDIFTATATTQAAVVAHVSINRDTGGTTLTYTGYVTTCPLQCGTLTPEDISVIYGLFVIDHIEDISIEVTM